MRFSQSGVFPRVDAYLRQSLPKVVTVPRIAHFMHLLGKLDQSEFMSALRPGAPPTLIVATIFPFGAAVTDKAIIVGIDHFVVTKKNDEIYMSYKLFKDFEAQAGEHFLEPSRVSALKGAPGAREIAGKTRGGLTTTMHGGAPHAGERSFGFFKDVEVFTLGANILAALVVWGRWKKEGIADPKLARQFAVEVYRNIMFP